MAVRIQLLRGELDVEGDLATVRQAWETAAAAGSSLFAVKARADGASRLVNPDHVESLQEVG